MTKIFECGNTLAEYVAIERRLRRAVYVVYAASDVFPDMCGAEHLAREAIEQYRTIESQAVRRWGIREVRQAVIKSYELTEAALTTPHGGQS